MYENLIALANKAREEDAQAKKLKNSARSNEYDAIKEFLNMNGIETGETVIRVKENGKEGVLYISQHVDRGCPIPCALYTGIEFYPLKKNGEASRIPSCDLPCPQMDDCFRYYNGETGEYIVDGKARSKAEMMFLHLQAFLKKIEITGKTAE